MNHEISQEAAELLQQAQRENEAPGQTAIAQRKVLRLVIRVLAIVLGELVLVGCSGGVFHSYNQSDSGEQWSSDAALSDHTTSDAMADSGAGGGTTLTAVDTGGQPVASLSGSGGSTSILQSSLIAGGNTGTGGSIFEATGGAQYHDPGECPCPNNNACQVSASGCNVPGTKGNEGNETFTCVVSPLHCATAARPVFCFQC